MPDGDEMTELFDADIPRVDLVGKGANGIPRFLIAKQDESAGLLDPEYVRDLIAKAEPGTGREQVTMPSGVTLTGSAADIAAFIHKAAERAGDVAKAKYDTADRKKMAGHEAMADGSYPVADKADLHNAIHAVGRGGASHDAIRAHIIRRAKALGASSEIPDDWNSDGSLKEGVSKEDAVTAAVAKDMELDEGVDGLDPTVPLAAPDEDAPGDPADPGSPAWEAIDAATAQKWTSIAVRLKNALSVMAEREMLEAASADPGDAENAFDLEDAQCAVDYVISTLAVFAAGEQAEADLGGEEMDMAKAADVTAIAKALADEQIPAALTAAETYSAVVRKSGRVLSAANEAHIREAHKRLAGVLSSLPSAPKTDDDGQQVAKMTPETEAAMPEATPSADVTSASGQQPAMGTAEAPPAAQEAVITKTAVGVFDSSRRFLGLAAPASIVAKADGDGKAPMQAVFDQDGDLIGVVDPAAIQPVAGAGKPEAEADAMPDDAPDADDMTPAPAADTGTPADAVADDGTVTKTQEQDTGPRDMLKGIVKEALGELLGAETAQGAVAKAADVAGLREALGEFTARLETVEKMSAPPGVFANGALPPAGSVPPARPSLRGQDQGAAPVDVAKAAELKRQMYSGSATTAEQNQAWGELMNMSIAKLTEITGRS